jgi:hypothetical protein
MGNPTNAKFNPPTANTDGSPIAAGEITSYLLEVGPVATPQSFPVSFKDLDIAPAPDGTISVPLDSLGALAPGNYMGVVIAQAGAVQSAPSDPAAFTIAAVVVTPNPPTGLTFV